MSIITTSKKAHSAFKFFTAILMFVACGSGVANIRPSDELPTPMPELVKDNTSAVAIQATKDLDCLAKNIYFEAGSESINGKKAVADVVVNRTQHPNYPKTICGVVYQGAHTSRTGCQFSWACDGMHKVIETNSTAWKDSMQIASEVLYTNKTGTLHDSTKGAIFFHNTTVRPRWASKGKLTARIGDHYFYR